MICASCQQSFMNKADLVYLIISELAGNNRTRSSNIPVVVSAGCNKDNFVTMKILVFLSAIYLYFWLKDC